MMDFYTISTFRESIAKLTKKSKEGYATVVKDICETLQSMDDNMLRDTNDRVFQYSGYRVIKLRIPNSGQNLAKSNGFRLIYWVSLKFNAVVLMRVYPKRGPQSAVNLTNAEYTRLQIETYKESQANCLHQVDISNSLAELSATASFSND